MKNNYKKKSIFKLNNHAGINYAYFNSEKFKRNIEILKTSNVDIK